MVSLILTPACEMGRQAVPHRGEGEARLLNGGLPELGWSFLGQGASLVCSPSALIEGGRGCRAPSAALAAHEPA